MSPSQHRVSLRHAELIRCLHNSVLPAAGRSRCASMCQCIDICINAAVAANHLIEVNTASSDMPGGRS